MSSFVVLLATLARSTGYAGSFLEHVLIRSAGLSDNIAADARCCGHALPNSLPPKVCWTTIAPMSEDAPEQVPVSRQPVTVRTQPGWIAPVSLGVAVIAVGVAVWALVSTPSTNAPSAPAAQQTADAKTRACTAFTTVRTAVALQTHTDLGPEPVAVQTVAGVSRLAMSSGATYLLANLDAAAPSELADAIRTFANDLSAISMYGQAGIGAAEPAQAARLRDGEAVSAKIAEMCK